ncbi:CDP-glycerol glycerophosphotransferase family protein [Arthrobacter mobilis]|uniref:CDP-glycerol--glycerophosphate glycerophosphotransferase n=1 Tax=Arthrobacter mobilis TaxID=2724944 RepID=A0A7X6QMI0_9MICC|nr:CDP-glycerol glycerophosphotransferase family protein [Arthrobacter mobilis]NKX56495.1 CDP-glycerol--glycerophosphate glycerophosphotransferase [Arthrobacter mobilis]
MPLSIFRAAASRTAPVRRALTVLGGQAADAVAARRLRRQLAAGSAAPERFDCVVYFADEPSSAYQVRQWFAPLAELARTHPVALLVHRATTAAELLKDSPLPLYLTSGIGEVERFIQDKAVRLVFYVNNNRDNFTVLRLTGQVHVHLSHGESDKISMASNQLKAYDYAFIAGQASRERILGRVRGLDPARLVEIGRPQLDSAVPEAGQDSTAGQDSGGRTTVLYAPTWEGDRPAMAYGSLASHGVEMARAILADPRYRLVFRPHPRTGVRLPAHRAAAEQITALVEDAVKRTPGAGHYVDRRPDFSVSMAEANVCICDLSAMAMDWLPRRKPLLLTRPAEPAAAVDPGGIAGVVPLLEASEAAGVVSRLDELLSRPVGQAQLDLVRHHFGDTSPGASTRRFLKAVDTVLGE